MAGFGENLASWDGLVRDGDLCPLVFLIWLLMYLGRFAVADSPRLQLFGFRMAAGVALLHALTDLAMTETLTPAALLLLLVRAIATGLLLLGVLWIVLAAVAVIWDHVRRVWGWTSGCFGRWQRTRQRRRQDALDRERQRLAAIEWERTRPERQRAAREAAERAQEQATALSLSAARQASDRSRREEARFGILVAYDQRAAGYGERIPRTRVLQYLDRYLGDDVPLDVIEERAQQLTQLLHETSQGGRTRSPFQGLEDIAATFQKRRDEILTLPYDQETRETLLVSLNAQEETAIREFLKP